MNQLEFEFLWPHRAIQLELEIDEMNNNERTIKTQYVDNIWIIEECKTEGIS